MENKKIKNKKIIKTAIKTTIVASLLFGTATCKIVGDKKIDEYNKENPLFSTEKVENDIKTYGADIKLVEKQFNIIQFKKNELYNHYNIDSSVINVGISSVFSDEQIKSFNYTFDYLNKIFSVINPDYQFETKVIDKNFDDCDIKIKYKSLHGNTAALTSCLFLPPNNSNVKNPTIYFNKNVKSSDSYCKYFLLHEMMHILLGSDDLKEKMDATLYDYVYLNSVVSHTDKVFSDESYHVWLEKILGGKEAREGFVTYFPKDLSALIALYGDSSKPENVERYTKLLNETLETCTKLFGELQYYEEGFELPTM